MRAPLRLLLLRLLLVAVFFNTAIGVPAHAIEHLREAQASLGEAQASLGDAQAPAERTEAHAACAWCSSYAQLAHALDMAPPRPCGIGPVAGHAVPQRSADAPPNADRWPFRARDPPQA